MAKAELLTSSRAGHVCQRTEACASSSSWRKTRDPKKKKEVRTTRCGRRKKKPHLSGVCAKGHSSRIASAKQGFLLLFLFATDLTAKWLLRLAIHWPTWHWFFFFPRAPPSSFSPKPIKTPLPAMLSRTEKSCLCRVYSFFGVDFLFIIIKTSCFSCASKAHSVSLYWQTLPGAKGILCCRCSNSAIIIIISH